MDCNQLQKRKEAEGITTNIHQTMHGWESTYMPSPMAKANDFKAAATLVEITGSHEALAPNCKAKHSTQEGHTKARAIQANTEKQKR